MKVFVVLCLLAVAYGKPTSMLRPNFGEPEANIHEITRPSAIPPPPQVIELPAELAPFVQIIVNIVKRQEIPVGTFPLFPEGELPPVGTFPLFPEEPEIAPLPFPFPQPEPLPVDPVEPEIRPLPFPFPQPEPLPVDPVEPELRPLPFPFPQEDLTKPAPAPVNPEFLRPSVNDQVEDIPLNNFNDNAERPAESIIRRY
ncbi:uncharacterized protein LOC143919888 [Arctopsyche grandis]|uniref:uncharacterized protein LOC143919888 n=1 Tax=Arctopsyche grandis TaxID=121162 RepID=UPI00406D771B